MTPLQQAAQAVIARWESPLWKDQPHTGVYIAELRKALGAEQAVEPVIYQRRMRPTWADEGAGWTTWENCLKESFLWSHKNPKIHDWEYEARALYLHPAPTPNGTIGNGSHRLVELDLLGAIAGALNRSKNAPNILEKVRGLIKQGGGVGRGLDAPYPGMIEAFEAHYGQSFTDKDWRNEAGIWAASWGCAVRQSPTPAGEHVPESCFGNTERAELIKALQDHYAFPCYPHGPEILAAANMLQADANQITELESSLDFYQRRVELLQTWQSKMRDPERTIACDIIANGQTLPSENAGDRYKIPVEAQQVAVPALMTDIEVLRAARAVQSVYERVPHRDVIEFARAIEAHHGIGAKP